MIDRSARLLLPCILCLCAHKVSFSSFADPETLVKTFLLGESHSPCFAFPVAVFSAQVEEVVPARSRAEVGRPSHTALFFAVQLMPSTNLRNPNLWVPSPEWWEQLR